MYPLHTLTNHNVIIIVSCHIEGGTYGTLSQLHTLIKPYFLSGKCYRIIVKIIVVKFIINLIRHVALAFSCEVENTFKYVYFLSLYWDLNYMKHFNTIYDMLFLPCSNSINPVISVFHRSNLVALDINIICIIGKG